MATAITRMTIAFSDETAERLKVVGEKFDISYARLIGCLLVSDEQIKAAIEENYGRLFPSAATEKRKEKAIMNIVKDMTPSQLAAILASAKAEG